MDLLSRIFAWLSDHEAGISAVAAIIVIGGVILALAGGDPFRTYAHIARASLGDLGVFSDTLVKATPLILVGLACSLAFRMKLWNIGAEGQFYVGAFGASALVLIPILPPETPRILMVSAMMLAKNPGAGAAGTECVAKDRNTPCWLPGPEASLQAIHMSAAARAKAERLIVDPPSYVAKSSR